MMRRHEPERIAAARRLRREMSVPERVLWARLRAYGVGLRVRRQVPMGSYVLDFHCASARLCIEVDGACHDERGERDGLRDTALAALGIATLRLLASDVMRDPDTCVEQVAALCRTRGAAAGD